MKNVIPNSAISPSRSFLGVECGGTRTVAILADSGQQCLQRLERNGAANLRLMTETQLADLFRGIAGQIARPDAVGIGMAGVLEEAERRLVRETAAKVWPGIPCWAGNDLETALAAARGKNGKLAQVQVIVISGTGASCFGRGPGGVEVLTGGWGHLLGDRGSGHHIALRALQAVFGEFDQTGRWPVLGRRLLRAAQINSPNELISWLHGSTKGNLAVLAIEVFAASSSGNAMAKQVLNEAAGDLAHNAVACAGRLTQVGQPVEFLFTGSVLLKQPAFARAVKRHLLALWPTAVVRLLEREGSWGAVFLAQQLQRAPKTSAGALHYRAPAPVNHAQALSDSTVPIPAAGGLSPTEMRNPRSARLDKLSVSAAVRLMLREDAALPGTLLREEGTIVKAVEMITDSLRQGGRLIYVGAGTSGRLGMLDASECPPTFNVSPETVQAIMAGGQQALWASLETAEDDPAGGAQAIVCRGVGSKDVVVGIAASGRTPFVWGALHQARKAGAKTILVCFNPELQFIEETRPMLVIAPRIGPEILTGSTRLKAGTATKLLLNIFTTLSMVRLGKVIENLMVDVQPSNTKLRERALRIVRELSGASVEEATKVLERSHWSVKKALAELRP